MSMSELRLPPATTFPLTRKQDFEYHARKIDDAVRDLRALCQLLDPQVASIQAAPEIKVETENLVYLQEPKPQPLFKTRNLLAGVGITGLFIAAALAADNPKGARQVIGTAQERIASVWQKSFY